MKAQLQANKLLCFDRKSLLGRSEDNTDFLREIIDLTFQKLTPSILTIIDTDSDFSTVNLFDVITVWNLGIFSTTQFLREMSCSKSRAYIFISNKFTVLKFHNFSITQILREINFGDSRSAKSAIYEFLHFLEAEIYQINKILST